MSELRLSRVDSCLVLFCLSSCTNSANLIVCCASCDAPQADAQRKANVICREIAPMAAVEYVESLERFVCETAATTHWLGGQLQTAVLERMHLKVRNVNIEHDMRALRSGGRSPARRMASSSGSDFESEGQGLDAGSPFMHGRRLGL